MWTDDIFDRVAELCEDRDIEFGIYDGEFLDPDRVQELANRYSTKDVALQDIEEVSVLDHDSTLKRVRCRIIGVIYAAHSNKRTEDLKVRGSIALAATISQKIVGETITASTDHSDSAFRFVEIVTEDRVPFMSVHAVRYSLDMVLSF